MKRTYPPGRCPFVDAVSSSPDKVRAGSSGNSAVENVSVEVPGRPRVQRVRSVIVNDNNNIYAYEIVLGRPTRHVVPLVRTVRAFNNRTIYVDSER